MVLLTAATIDAAPAPAWSEGAGREPAPSATAVSTPSPARRPHRYAWGDNKWTTGMGATLISSGFTMAGGAGLAVLTEPRSDNETPSRPLHVIGLGVFGLLRRSMAARPALACRTLPYSTLHSPTPRGIVRSVRRSRSGRWLWEARGRALVLVFAALTASCQDNEQRARGMGAEARDAIARACVADAGDEDAEAACVDQRCRAACEESEVPTGFDVPCLDACRQTGVCATNADCDNGKECVAIAPVFRKCVTKEKPAP